MQNTHEKIIQAANELFERNGFAAATTKEIAGKAGVSEVTLFRHFKTKRGLFEEALHSRLHPFSIGGYLKNEASYDLERDLNQIAFSLKEVYEHNFHTFRMIMRDKIRNSAHEMRYHRGEHDFELHLNRYFEKMNDKGLTNADPQMAAKFFITNIAGYLFKELFSGRQPDEAYFAWMLGKVISVIKEAKI